MSQSLPPESLSNLVEPGETFPGPSQSQSGEDVTAILPNQIMAAEVVGQTDVGQERHHNEDFFITRHQLTQHSSPRIRETSLRGLYILCDGMGGHAKGEVASALAAETLVEQLYPQWQSELPNLEVIEAAILAANDAIYRVNEENAKSGQDRMGTTLVLSMIQDTQVHIAHVGDSRIYALTESRGLEQLTVDHEVGQQDIQRGVKPTVAYRRPDAYQLTQALGPRKNQEVKPELGSLTISENTLLLLCSDGLTDNNLLEAHCSTHLQPLLDPATSLQKGVRQLIELANRESGHDNITVLAVRLWVQPQPQTY